MRTTTFLSLPHAVLIIQDLPDFGKDIGELLEQVPTNSRDSSVPQCEWRWREMCEFRSQRKGAKIRYHLYISLEVMSNQMLDKNLSLFIIEARRKDGEKCPPSTLHGVIAAIRHHLKMRGRDTKLFNDSEFSQLRSCLDASMKEAASEGLGRSKKQAEMITLNEEGQLWNQDLLGDKHPQQLLNTIVYLLGLHFALRGIQEHRRLRRINSQMSVCKDEKRGLKFLEYCEDVSKTNAGRLRDRKVKPKSTRAYEQKPYPQAWRAGCIIFDSAQASQAKLLVIGGMQFEAISVPLHTNR
ncbi:uncharacterized protein KIAA1958-like [Actinia tenebrosa]|uniref:Uncharacterized protein KIAA1958-like n=1 Tax=Actinia tenebrosa TaxID=6105 RepID=A0A6P8HDE1_ACTTE|nr:uncharacterized protein KIAA1958-like [Actinia tenebrosa]